MSYDFADVLGFAGGFACGATLSGLRLVAKREEKGGFGAPLMEANRVFLGDEWRTQIGEPEEWEPVDVPIVLGNPPCSGFSSMTYGTGKSHGIHAPINKCMWNMWGYAGRVKPHAVVMESVTNAYRQGLPLMRALVEDLEHKTQKKYFTTHVIQDNLSLGGCTRRKRYFLVATQVPFGVERADLVTLPTLEDAIGDLVNLDITWEPQQLTLPASWWSMGMRSPDGVVDGHMVPANLFTKRIMDVAGPGGVAWNEGESVVDAMRRYYEERGDLPDSWKYHSPGPNASPLTRDKQLIERDFDGGGFSKPLCWPWDKPGRVINGAGPYQLWHRDGRFATHREVARILGFPDAWVVGSARAARGLHSFWGKGTSVAPAHWVTTWLRRSLDGEPGSVIGEPQEDGSRVIDVSKDWQRVDRLKSHAVQLANSVV